MKRFPEIARRAVSLALAASMSLSVLAPCASAAATARDLENSVDELGNVDLSDEVYNVPGDTAFTAADTAADPLGGDDEEEIDLDDLTEEQLAEQAVVDEAGHTEHTPDTDAEPVYEQPATCAERGYAIYPCSFTLEQEDGTVAHCYHQVVVWLPLADHAWGEWQEPDDADSQKYRVCTVCNAVEYEDGTVVTPGGIPITDPDQPEWLPGDGQVDTCGLGDYIRKQYNKVVEGIKNAYNDLKKDLDEKIEKAKADSQKTLDERYPDDHDPSKSNVLIQTDKHDVTCLEDGYIKYKCTRTDEQRVSSSINNPIKDIYNRLPSSWQKKVQDTLKNNGLEALGNQLGNDKFTLSFDVKLTCEHDENNPIVVTTEKAAGHHEFPDENDPANWKVTKKPTCKEDGEETLTCIGACKGKEEGGVKIRKIGHEDVEHQWVKIDSVAATCEKDGYDRYQCSVCGDKEDRKTADALGHDYQNYADDRNPACQEQTATGHCTRCGGADTKVTSAALVPHKFTTWTGTGISVSGQYLYYESTCDICHEKTKQINVAEKKLDDLDEALDGDPLTATDDELLEVDGLYNGAKAAITVLEYANKHLHTSFNTEKYTARLDEMTDRYKKFEHESLQRGCEKTASEAIKKAHETIDNKDPSEMTNDEMKEVIGAYVAASAAVGQLDDGRAKKTELQAELAELKKTVEEIESKYAQKVIEGVWDDLKNGTLDKTKLEALKKTLEDLEPMIPDSLKESYEQVVDAVDAAIKAIDLVNNASALIKKLQEEIKNGNISQDTVKQLQDLVKQARDLADQIKENPILKNAVDTIIKNAEKALKEAAANKALDALKEAIKNGDLSKIDEAFDQAQKAIDELRHYAPEVADKLSNALEEIKKTYLHGIKDELEKALKDGTYQEKLDKLKDVVKKYEDMIKDIDASGALKELWDTILNEELTKLITDTANEINKIVNDKDMSALDKIAALNELSDDLHKQLEDIVGKDRADKLLEPFDKLIEQAKETVAKAAAAAGDSLIKEALKAIKQAVDSAENKEDAINQIESIYDQAHELLTKAGMSNEDATAKLEPVRSAIDSVKKLLDESFVSMDTIKAAVDVLVDAMLESGTIEGGLHDLVRTVLDGKNLDPAVTRVILVVARDVLKKADWSRLTPSLLDDVMDMAIDKAKKKISKKYNSTIAKIANDLIDELKPTMNDLVHKEVGQDTIDKVRDVFLNAIDNGIAGIDAGKNREELLDTARDDLLKLSPVISAELKRIGAKAAESVNKEMHDKVTAALPGVILPNLIGDLIGNLAEDIVNKEIGKEDPKITAEIDKYVKYLTCPGHKHATRISQALGCTTDEIQEDYCTRCDWVFSKTKIADALGHDPVTVPGVEPTETADGLTDGIQCARCGAWLEPQEVIPAQEPQYEKYLVKSAVTADTAKAAGYKNQKKLDEAIDAALTKAGYQTANSERFLAQVQTSIGILSNDRYPEDGVTGMVKLPAGAAGKNCTFYAVQVLTADTHGYSAGDVVVTPLTVTSEGISFKLPVQSVVAIAWKVNE